MNHLKDKLKLAATEDSCAAFGVADLRPFRDSEPSIFENTGQSFPFAIVMGLRLQDSVVEDIINQPTPLYFHNYRQTNYQLDKLAWTIADLIQTSGFNAMAIPASQIIRRDPMQGHISHRRLAVQAGIGFIGRNNLLVHPRYGARMRYVSVLTDAEIEPDKPYDGEGCGSCRACISPCPAGAIHESYSEYDLNACYAKLTEFTRIPYTGQHICGVCVKACSAKARTRLQL